VTEHIEYDNISCRPPTVPYQNRWGQWRTEGAEGTSRPGRHFQKGAAHPKGDGTSKRRRHFQRGAV